LPTNPRRGGRTTATHRADPAAVAGLRQRVADQSAAIEQVLADQRSDSDLVAAGRALLHGSPSPRGAAVIATEFPERRVENMWVNTRVDGDWVRPDTSPCFGGLDPVTAAEVLAELTDLCSA
jgi:hypothetical protein